MFQALSGPGRRRAALRYYRSIQRPEGFKAAFRIEPKQPVLFLHGEQDRIVPSSHSQWLARQCPSAQLRLLPGDGHVSVLNAGAQALEWLAAAHRGS